MAAYSFNEPSGAIVLDSSGGNNDGTITAATRVTNGRFGGALSFNARASNHHYVTVPDATALRLTGGMTLEAWVNPNILGNGSANWRTVIFKERSGGFAYALYANNKNSRPAGKIYIGSEQTVLGSGILPLNSWSHLATTFDGTRLRLYVNGIQVATKAQSGSIVSATGALKIGGNAIWGEWFGGLIDEVRIYNHALTQIEIQTDMNTPVPGDTSPPTAPTGLVRTGQTDTSMSFSWIASTDNVGVEGYGVYKNSQLVSTTTSTSATLGNLTCGTNYGISVDAFDAAGNRSPQTGITASTLACDVTPPSAQITAPPNGATVNGTVAVSANASDNRGVAGVQFTVDGANLGPEDTTSPYSTNWNTTTVGNGAHSLTAVARDTAGNTAGSPAVSVTVANSDSTPPTVDLTAPPAGASVRSTVGVSATASDNVGVAGVQFWLDGANLGAEDTTAPYGVAWDTTSASNGSHSLTTTARDAAGNTATSTAVLVTVDNSAPATSITSPVEGQVVSDTIDVTAEASDNVGVAGVQFKLDGAGLGPEDVTVPYSIIWATASVGNGTHVLTSTARDAAGNVTTSPPVTITVENGGILNTEDAWTRVTIGPGIVDGSTRTVVRTAGDRVYVFSMDDSARGSGTGPSVIRAWKGNRTGIPTGFTEVGATSRPTALQGPPFALTSASVQLDRNGIVHLVFMDESNDSVNYQTFSTLTDTWGPRELIDSGIGVDFDGNDLYKRDATNAIVLDATEKPHVVYRSGASLIYRNRTSGSWSPPELVETASIGTPRHAELAADAVGNFHLSWVQSDWRQSPNPHPMIKYKKRSSAGVWGPTEIADETDVQNNDSSDQGPSVIVTQSGTPYILYLSDRDPQGSCCGSGVQTVYRDAGTGSWISDNPPTNTFAHAPQIYSQYNDIYAFAGHDSGVNFAYRYHLAGQSWSNYIRLDTTSDTDGSAAPRWDPLRETNGDVIDVAFYEENLYNDARHIPEAYYMAILPSGGPVDTEAPTVPTGLAVTGSSENTISVRWSPSTDDVGIAGYTLYRSSIAVGTTSTTSAVFDQLSCGTTYNLEVDAYDQAGNHSGRASLSAATAPCDPSPPSVQISSPADGATVSGVVPVNASASDNTGIAGVQFKLDGSNLGVEDTTSPYGVSWPTGSSSNGSHTLTAVARDLSGNLTTSTAVTVMVSNLSSPGLVAAYNFDQGVGTILSDRSGNANNGTVSGATWSTSGKYGGALAFDGVNDIVSVSDSASLDLTTGMTLEAWTNPSALGSGSSNWRTTAFKQQPGGMVYALYANNGSGARPAGQVNIGGERNVVGTAQLPLDVWTHLAVTYDGGSLKLYVNGTQAASTTVGGSISVSTGALTIGGNTVWSEWFQGRIDDMRIYNRALSVTEIQADMNTAVS